MPKNISTLQRKESRKMKILVFSDSHGSAFNMQKAVNMHPDAEYILHLGDGVEDLRYIKHSIPNVIAVSGNHEDFTPLEDKQPHTRVLEIAGKRIFMCHGHKQKVRLGLHNLYYTANEENVDIALYGHTHIKRNDYTPLAESPDQIRSGVYFFNPGSISQPRDDFYSSFGLIDIQPNGVLLSHGLITK